MNPRVHGRRNVRHLAGIVLLVSSGTVAAAILFSHQQSAHRREKAQAYFKQALQMVERQELGESSLRLAQALHHLDRAKQLDSGNVDARLLRGRILEGSAHFGEARDEYVAAYRLRPADPRIALAALQLSIYLPEREVEAFAREAVANAPDNGALHYQLALVMLKSPVFAKRKEALAELKMAKELMPGSTVARIELGKLYKALGEVKPARREFYESRDILDEVARSGKPMPLNLLEDWIEQRRTIAFHEAELLRADKEPSASKSAAKLAANLGEHASELRSLKDRANVVPADAEAKSRLQSITDRGLHYWKDVQQAYLQTSR